MVAMIMPIIKLVSSKLYILLLRIPYFNLYIIYKYKPLANNFWIFAFGLLVVVFTCKMRLKFWLALDEVVSLLYTYFGRVAFV